MKTVIGMFNDLMGSRFFTLLFFGAFLYSFISTPEWGFVKIANLVLIVITLIEAAVKDILGDY